MPTKYTVSVKIIGLEERFDRAWVSGKGAECVFEDRSRGWFLITTVGTFGFGQDKPEELKAGKIVQITFEAMEASK